MKRRYRAVLILAVLALCFCATQLSFAAPISGVGVTATSELFPGFDRRAIHMVNGSGMTGTAHGTVPDGSMWLSRGTFAAPNDPSPTVTFDLGTLYSVSSMQVWNYNENPPNLTARGINTADILVAGEDSVFFPFIAAQAFTQAPGTASDFSQTIPLGDIEVRYVQLTNMTHFPGGDNAFFGLSEVRFDGTVVGPPPPPPHPGLSPVFARASSFYQSGTDIRRPDDVVNNNGVTVGNGHAIGPPSGTMWLSAAGDATGDFEIDLRGVHDLNTLRVWNYNENASPIDCCLTRGVREVDVYVAGQDHVYGPTPVLSTTFAIAPGVSNVDFSQVASLAGSQARYIKLDVRSNHGDADFTGLSEVKVTGTPVLQGLAPLPATIKAVSSNLSGFDRRADYVANGAGMRFGDTHTNDPTGNMWLNQGTLGGAPPDTSPEITFDLGSEVALGRMKVWNYAEYRDDLRNPPPPNPPRFNELLGRGIRHADILVAGEDMIFRPLLEDYEFARVPDVGDLAAFLATDFGQVVDLGGVVARYVKFDILSNHNGRVFDDPFSDDGLANFAGLSEVQFFAVPEPSTYLMAVIAALAAFALRRRPAR